MNEDYFPIGVVEPGIDRLDDITLGKPYKLKEQIDEGKPRERALAAIGRRAITEYVG